ncbi:MAG TPA: TetR/AcrR family transcriptional regulator [Spirochaetota bacterium]|nr:TetR/AcrR family transcriptional regulator [Spirochaetota bacterium]HPJ37083.1 TetR/AcrR family transcriptional regulator [Spirochaetota bacterium]HPQ53432.1 TetR/AcrR family transcriptional regulator [Spirochaetota bacterium]
MGATERREREKLARKNHILDAARTLLFKKGLHATTVNQIAKLSELSVGTIYLYYTNKEEIFAALQNEGFDILYKLMVKASQKGKDPVEKVRNIAITYVDFSENHKNYFDIINYFLSTPELLFPPMLKNRVDRTAGKSLQILIDTIEEGVNAGVFKNVNPAKHAVSLWGALHGLIHFKKLEHTMLQNENYRDYINYMLDDFMKNLCRKK